MNDRVFGKYLAYLRHAKNLTQGQLSIVLSVSEKAISKWENGQCYPHAEKMPRLAEALGVTVEDLQRNKISKEED